MLETNLRNYSLKVTDLQGRELTFFKGLSGTQELNLSNYVGQLVLLIQDQGSGLIFTEKIMIVH